MTYSERFRDSPVSHAPMFFGRAPYYLAYQQYFCIRRILDRVQHRDTDGSRCGGVVWHTEGSGKSLTMVMLAKGLALDLPRQGVDDFEVVRVTDRVDLDDQIYGTFKNCGTAPIQATTGRHLANCSVVIRAGSSRCPSMNRRPPLVSLVTRKI